jgi:hypothetical protein
LTSSVPPLLLLAKPEKNLGRVYSIILNAIKQERGRSKTYVLATWVCTQVETIIGIGNTFS